MSKKILRQRVLDKLANEEDAGSWNQYVQRLKSVADDSFTPRIAKRAVDLALEEVEKEIDEIEEGFEGTAVEFCEKHGDASYTGFKECLKDIRSHLSLAAKKKEAFNE